MSAPDETMNCEDYKEAIAADPTESFEHGAEHAAACESCSAFKAEMKALDEMLGRALHIDVPDLEMPELPALDADDDKVTNLPFRRSTPMTTPAWIGIAAGFALAAVIGVQFIGGETGSDQLLADEVLSHLDHEPWALEVTDVAVSEERFARVVNPGVGTINGSIGLVSYAQTCVIKGKPTPHLVVQGEKGPITILLMPDEPVTSALSLIGDGVTGVILPVGEGSIAIIGDREEQLQDYQQQLVNAVEWSI
jgi:hypothetical protein